MDQNENTRQNSDTNESASGGTTIPIDGGAENASTEEEVAKLRDQLLRTAADFDNYRRRARSEQEQLIQYGNERLLRALLPFVDDLRRSVESGEKVEERSREFESFFQGVSMIADKVMRLLESQGVERIETVGKPFDVNLHEALLHQPSDEPEGTIIAELEPGYTYGDRVLRHARVMVSAGVGQ